MKRIALVTMLCLGAPAIVQAQTCASPTPIFSNSNYAGTTCGGEAGINMGGTVYGHPSVVYSFVANNANGPITLTGTDREMSLTTSCTSAPLAAGAPGLPICFGAGAGCITLTNGTTYLLVVSTDPSIPVAAPPVCGPASFTTSTLPVALQKFSVE